MKINKTLYIGTIVALLVLLGFFGYLAYKAPKEITKEITKEVIVEKPVIKIETKIKVVEDKTRLEALKLEFDKISAENAALKLAIASINPSIIFKTITINQSPIVVTTTPIIINPPKFPKLDCKIVEVIKKIGNKEFKIPKLICEKK